MKFDVVVIGGGYVGFQKACAALSQGKSCALVSRGKSLDRIDYSSFVRDGGVFLLGDTAVSGEISDGRLLKIYTEKLGSTALEADEFILATGRFFSGGLSSDMNSVFEPLLGLDVFFEADPSLWFNADFFEDQPFSHFGVKTDPSGHPFKDGVVVSNLTVVGDILAN